jgi:pimeloyl-ACP methyl ester carboxylesterase
MLKIIFLLFSNFIIINSKLLPNHRDIVTDLISEYGYPVKTYEIITSDGYILRMHRLFAKNDFKSQIHHKPGCPIKPAVLIVHGFTGCSSDFVLFGPNKSLGFQLVDNGYDVWLGNVRGGKLTESHVSMKSSMPEFWNYTITEVSIIDTANMIDYVRDVSGSFKIFYIGNSFGATYLAILLSERPEYNEKIIQAGLMAPILYTGQKVPENVLSSIANRAFYSMLQMTPVFRYSDILDFAKFYQTMFCAPRNSECPVVLTIRGMLYGWNEDGKYMDSVKINLI